MDFEISDEEEIAEQAERCRRLASMMVDDELRRSLERLAREYEAELRDRGEGFMLCGNGEEGGGSAAGAR